MWATSSILLCGLTYVKAEYINSKMFVKSTTSSICVSVSPDGSNSVPISIHRRARIRTLGNWICLEMRNEKEKKAQMQSVKE